MSPGDRTERQRPKGHRARSEVLLQSRRSIELVSRNVSCASKGIVRHRCYHFVERENAGGGSSLLISGAIASIQARAAAFFCSCSSSCSARCFRLRCFAHASRRENADGPQEALPSRCRYLIRHRTSDGRWMSGGSNALASAQDAPSRGGRVRQEFSGGRGTALAVGFAALASPRVALSEEQALEFVIACGVAVKVVDGRRNVINQAVRRAERFGPTRSARIAAATSVGRRRQDLPRPGASEPKAPESTFAAAHGHRHR